MKATSNIRFVSLFAAILLIVVMAIAGFFALIRNEIISLSAERMNIVSENCTNNISIWAGKILGELDIYRAIVEKEGGTMNEHTKELVLTTLGAHTEYPYGLFWADKNDNIFLASGWYDEGYIPTERSWFTEGLGHVHFEYGEPYIDAFTGEPCVSATARIYTNGVEGVMAADVYLNYVSGVVRDVASSEEIEKAFIVTMKSRRIVADSGSAMYLKKLGEADSPLYKSIDDLLNRHFIGQTEVIAEGETYYINVNRIDSTDWLFVTCMNKKAVTEKLAGAEVIMLFIGLAGFAALVLLAFLTARQMKAAVNKAKTDALTGLLNRDGLKSVCLQNMELNSEQGMFIIMDMDNFKQINDNFGHPEGDEVLKSFAVLLTEYFNRNRDYVARLGGDEFAVFVGRHVEVDNLSLMLDKFMERFHSKYDEKYSSYGLSISIGVAFVINSFGDYGRLYRNADDALYRAKQNGKNKYVYEE